MGVAKQRFFGDSTVIPGVYTQQIFPPGLGGIGADTNIVAVIGESIGGIPYNTPDFDENERLNVLRSTGDVTDIMEGGAAATMAHFYLTPSKDASLIRPPVVVFFRVDPATKGTSTLIDAGSDNIIDLVTTKYGVSANQISRQIEVGANIGHKVTIKFKGETISEDDDIALEYLDIQYTGAGSAATMTITGNTLTTSVTAGPGGEDLAITLSEFTRMGPLVSFINDQAAYTCTLKGSSDADTSTFDAATAVDIRTAAYTAVALVEALIQYFNSRSGGLITASLFPAAIRDNVVNDSAFVFFGGGAKGTATNTDWANTLELMEKFTINGILPATGDPTIHSLVDDHVRRMSVPIEGKNRVAASGASLGKTDAVMIAEMKALDSARFQYCTETFSREDLFNNNALTEFDPFYGAALEFGVRYGNNITMSSTFKQVNMQKLSRALNRTQKETLISAGATLFELAGGNFTVVRSISTFQGDNLILNTPAALRTADFIALDSNIRLLARIAALPKSPTQIEIEELKNFIITNLLPGYRDQGFLTNDFNTGDPAFTDLEFELIGNRFNFKFTGILVVPLEFLFQEHKFVTTGQGLQQAA